MFVKRAVSYFCLILLMVSIHLPIYAQPEAELYQAVLVANSQTEGERQKLLPQAMLQVLIKLTANPQLTELPGLKAHLAQATRYVQQYHYTHSGKKTLLWVNFDPTTIDGLLQKLGQPILTSKRPLLLVWLARDSNGSHAIVDEADQLSQQLKLAAEQWGIKCIFPAYDLEDMQQVTPDDLWAPNLAPILQTAKRYQADNLLIGRIIHEGTQSWSMQLQLGNQERWQTISAGGNSIEEVMQQVMEQLLVKLAGANQATLEEKPIKQKIEVLVNGVTGLADYQKVLAYLQNLPAVQSVQVLNVGADQVTFSIATQGTQDELIVAIQQGQELIPTPKTQQDILEYELKS